MKKSIASTLTGLVTGFVNGLFGSGGGILLVPALQKFFKLEQHKSHATALAIILPISVLSAFIYVKGGSVDWRAVLFVTLGGVPGGYVGALLLNKIPTKWLHKIFGAFIIVAAIRMVMG